MEGKRGMFSVGAAPGPRLRRNAARCRLCATVVETRHRHELQVCSCGAVGVDGGLDYLRRLGRAADREELNEWEEEDTSG